MAAPEILEEVPEIADSRPDLYVVAPGPERLNDETKEAFAGRILAEVAGDLQRQQSLKELYEQRDMGYAHLMHTYHLAGGREERDPKWEVVRHALFDQAEYELNISTAEMRADEVRENIKRADVDVERALQVQDRWQAVLAVSGIAHYVMTEARSALVRRVTHRVDSVKYE